MKNGMLEHSRKRTFEEIFYIARRPRKAVVSMHTHDCIELVYIYKGEGFLRIGEQLIKVASGDLLFYNIGELHCLNSEKEIDVINLNIYPQLLDESLATSQNAVDVLALAWFRDFDGIITSFSPKVTFRGKERIEIETVVSSMLEEYTQKRTGYRSVLFGYLNVLFLKLFRQIYMETRMDLREEIPRITDDVLQFMENNYNKKISLNELARQSFYNPSYFSSVFKECFGVTPVQYINGKRIEKAAAILETGMSSVEDVMRTVGYSDKKHFYYLFKKLTGFTPGDYRKNAKNTPHN